MSNPISLRAYKPRIDQLKGRVILVTGANRGIGRAVSRDLARHGATVILHGRDARALDALYDEIGTSSTVSSTTPAFSGTAVL